MGVQILSNLNLDAATRQRLQALPGVNVKILPQHTAVWEVPDELARGQQVLVCKYPPQNLDAMTDLQFIQLSSVGFDHLRDRGLGDRPFRVCNARGLFDTAIAE